jgi:hypothetical protein
MFRYPRGIAAIAILSSLAASPIRSEEKLYPLDPLTAQERETAARVAREDKSVREQLAGKRTRLIYVEFIAVKSGQTDEQNDRPAHRQADVLFYRYDENLGVRVLVDVTTKAVVDVVRVNGGSVPISIEEVEEAARLALADANVARLVGESLSRYRVATRSATAKDVNTDRIEGLRTLGTSPEDPCYLHRCVVLFFRANNHYVHLNRVTVDLTSQTVYVRGGEK